MTTIAHRDCGSCCPPRRCEGLRDTPIRAKFQLPHEADARLDAVQNAGLESGPRLGVPDENPIPFRRLAPLAAILALAAQAVCRRAAPAAAGYDALVTLFAEWRAFERPPLRDGAPDYTAATFARRHAGAAGLPQARLAAIDAGRWPVEAAGGSALVRAEMNGFDFYVRVLQALGARPGLLPDRSGTTQSDTPAHEGHDASRRHRAVEVRLPAVARRTKRKLAGELAHRSRRSSRRRAATSPATRATSGSPAPARCASRSRLSTRWQKRPPAAGARSGARSARRARRRSPSSTGSTPRRRRRRALPGSARRTTPGACRTSTSCR